MTKYLMLRCIYLLGVSGLGLGVANAQYPSKPIRIVTSPSGGGADFASRLIAKAISGTLGQQVIVDNRPTTTLTDIVASAAPDGYTLLLTGSAHWIAPLLDKVSYDPLKDFAAITLIDRSPNVLVVHPSMPVKTVKDLIALAKARPGEVNVAVGGRGSSNFVATVLFVHMAGVNMLRVPYRGSGPATVSVLSGETHAIFASAGTVAPHIKAGRLRVLGVSGAKPSVLAPGVPTIAESGVPGYEAESLRAMLAPAKTPPAVVARIHQEVARYLQSAEAQSIFRKQGTDPEPSSPKELIAIMSAEMDRMGKVFRAAGM